MIIDHGGWITTEICAFVVSFQERCWQQVHNGGEEQSYNDQNWFIQEWYDRWSEDHPYHSWCHFIERVGA